jgi:hypothetical protein
MRTTKRTLPKHPEPKLPSHVLRDADLRQMISDGTIDQQHFLIRKLAANLQEPDVSMRERSLFLGSAAAMFPEGRRS